MKVLALSRWLERLQNERAMQRLIEFQEWRDTGALQTMSSWRWSRRLDMLGPVLEWVLVLGGCAALGALLGWLGGRYIGP